MRAPSPSPFPSSGVAGGVGGPNNIRPAVLGCVCVREREEEEEERERARERAYERESENEKRDNPGDDSLRE